MRAITNSLLLGSALMALGWASAAHAEKADPKKADSAASADAGTTDAPAQSSAQSDDQSSNTTAGADIVVTAQRRSQSLQNVPVTVTVFTAKEIQDARIQQIGDVVGRTVGVQFDAFPATQPRLAIRGIGSSDMGASGDPSSAVFLDDIYLGRPSAIAFDAFDVERIEVLKGPQGTLFGRNVVGGAINVITKRPDISGFDASAELTYGNYNQFDAAAYVNVPVAHNTGAIRVSGAYRTHDGYVHNDYLDKDVDDQDTFSGRFQYYGELTPDLNFLFTVDHTRDRATGPANHVFELDTTDPLSNFYTVFQDPKVTYGTQVGHQNRDTTGIRGEINYDMSFATLTFLGSYRDLTYDVGYDFDGGNPDPASPGYNRINISGGNQEKSQLSSQEVRLSSRDGSPIQWVTGFYHYHQQTRRADIFYLDAPIIAPIQLADIYNQYAVIDSIAFYGDATVPLTDKISIIGGVRYTRDDKSYHIKNTNGTAVLRASEFFDVQTSASFDAVTYRAGVQFKPTSDHLLYATVSSGFKSGGFQDTPDSAVAAAMPFKPEKATQFEIGQKSRFFNGHVIWNNTLFYTDYTDLQTRQVDPSTAAIFTTNAGKATIKGYETQLDIRLANGLALSAAYAYTDARLKDYTENGVDLSGNQISRTPEHKASISPSYTYSFPSGADLSFTVDYRYESMIYDDNSNLPPEIRPATNFVDARIVLNKLAGHLTISAWAKNLTDERTRTFQSVFLGANFGAYNPPRTYGLTLRWNY